MSHRKHMFDKTGICIFCDLCSETSCCPSYNEDECSWENVWDYSAMMENVREMAKQILRKEK